MRRSFNWSSPLADPRVVGWKYGLLLPCLLSSLMTACTAPTHIPLYFEPLARTPVDPIPIKTVLVHGQRLAYLDAGSGPPIILIHGFGGSMWQWEHQQHVLSRQFRTLTLDLPGSGLSDKPDIAYHPTQMMDFFVGFMDALEIPQATLVGNSMGAGLAIGMALTHPTRVDKLVLIDGLPSDILHNVTAPSFRRALESNAPWWLVSVGNRLFGWFVSDSVLKEIIHDHSLLTPAVLERSNRNRRRPGIIKPLMAIKQTLPTWEADFAPRIKDLVHPTMIIWGEYDRVFPVKVGEELHRSIHRSTFVTIPEAGHMPQWERPDLVNRSLIEYIHPSPCTQRSSGGSPLPALERSSHANEIVDCHD